MGILWSWVIDLKSIEYLETLNMNKCSNTLVLDSAVGTCMAAGHSTCCVGGDCGGSPLSCYCDANCHMFGDCCQDVPTDCISAGKHSIYHRILHVITCIWLRIRVLTSFWGHIPLGVPFVFSSTVPWMFFVQDLPRTWYMLVSCLFIWWLCQSMRLTLKLEPE